MKTMKKKLPIIAFLIMITLLATSCKKDDAPSISRPTITYDSNNIEATFQQAGNSIPTIDWNGDTGTLQLVQSYTGGIPNLSFDTTTGIISWTKLLGEGHWVFDVVATNSAGSTTLEMSIDNTLQGTFTGIYNTSAYFQIIFSTDHSVIINADDSTNPTTATGTWTISNDDVVKINYTYDNTFSEFSLKGDLIRNNTSVVYSGNWYNGFDAIDVNQGGTFSVTLEE